MFDPRLRSHGRVLAAVTTTLVLGVATGTTFAQSAGAPSSESLMDKAIEAMGGKAIKKIKSYMSSAEMTTPMGNMVTDTFWAKPDRVLVKRVIPSMGEMTMGAEGKTGWTQNPMDGSYMLLPAEEVNDQVMHMQLLHLKEELKKYKLEPVKDAEFGGASTHELGFRSDEEGVTGSMYFAKDTNLIAGMEISQMGQKTTIMLKDWKEIEGVKFFHAMDVVSAGMNMGMKFKKIELNKVDMAMMKTPDEVVALASKQTGKAGGEMALEDFSAPVQQMINQMMSSLPWDQPEQLKAARAGMAGQADRLPGEHGQAMKYVVRKIDEALKGGAAGGGSAVGGGATAGGGSGSAGGG